MFTVLGATGFIGSHLVRQLKKTGVEVYAPQRGDQGVFSKNLGHVIYCIGMTADFREKPLETADAHVSVLVDFLKKAKFESFLYLSSTRVYEGATATEESADLVVNPSNPNHIFNTTKLAGEACCLSQANNKIRIVRLSNVIGPDYESKNFLFSVLKDAIEKNSVTLHTTPTSAKDYITVEDVVSIIPRIAVEGKSRLYNLASGMNISNQALLDKVSSLSGAKIQYHQDAKEIIFKPIVIDRIKKEFGFNPNNPIDHLSVVYEGFSSFLKKTKVNP